MNHIYRLRSVRNVTEKTLRVQRGSEDVGGVGSVEVSTALRSQVPIVESHVHNFHELHL